MGSACETEYHLLLAHDLQFLPQQNYDTRAVQIIEVKRMLSALIKRLKAER